ncbi:hypothetical protein, partial [Proteus mirabilis]|uniref:hypothetical protein n=1 Tax=Proteus mirabilis TaxID=584 RepID=UPI001C63CBCC
DNSSDRHTRERAELVKVWRYRFPLPILNFLPASPERNASFIEISRGGKLPYKAEDRRICQKGKRARNQVNRITI